MRAARTLLPLFILFAAAAVFASAQQGARTLVSPDRALRAIITPTGPGGREANESLVEIRGARSGLLLRKSFASGDGEHGYGVVRAEWTPDSQFFVFSAQSSGGHQPWHAPTFAYRRADRRLLAVDDLIGPVSSPLFEVRRPGLLYTERWVVAKQAGRRITVRLDELSPGTRGRKGAQGIGSKR